MTEKPKGRIPQINISSWYILLLCIIATIITSHYLSMYGTVHWPILTSSYKLKYHIENISHDEEANLFIQENHNLKIFFDALPDISEKIHKAGWRLMGKTGLYNIIGLVSFIMAMLAFFCHPRWAGIIALPFGIYSISMAMVIM